MDNRQEIYDIVLNTIKVKPTLQEIKNEKGEVFKLNEIIQLSDQHFFNDIAQIKYIYDKNLIVVLVEKNQWLGTAKLEHLEKTNVKTIKNTRPDEDVEFFIRVHLDFQKKKKSFR